MDEFLKNVVSMSWWVGVVFVSIVLNLFSAYIKPLFDGIFSSFSKRWRMRSEKARRLFRLEIEWLVQDRHRQIIYLSKENRCRLKSVHAFGFALLMCMVAITNKPSIKGSFDIHNLSHLSHILILLTMLLSLLESFQLIVKADRYAALVDAAVKDEEKQATLQN